jgi:hypothetical protein
VVTDLGVLEPDPASGELVVVARHPGVDDAELRAATGWELRFAPEVATTEPPTAAELAALAAMRAAAEAHVAVTARDVRRRRQRERGAVA